MILCTKFRFFSQGRRRTDMRWLTLGYVTVLLYHMVLGWSTHGQFPNPILSEVRIKYWYFCHWYTSVNAFQVKVYNKYIYIYSRGCQAQGKQGIWMFKHRENFEVSKVLSFYGMFLCSFDLCSKFWVGKLKIKCGCSRIEVAVWRGLLVVYLSGIVVE